jgi:uncharacterized iron-regulated protein
MKVLIAVLVSLPLLSACASTDRTRTEVTTWLSPLDVEHALVGKIWDARAVSIITQIQLLTVLKDSRVVILGEKHDNPDHHAIQREILAELSASGDLRAVSFEMLDSSQQAALDTLAEVDLGSESAVRTHLQWDDEGWDWDLYGPLVMDTARAGVTLRAANISTDEMMAVYGSELPEEVASALGAAQVAKLHTEIDESHCGMLPESQFPAMVRVQQARDASMADSIDAGAQGTHALIAGNFHARRDLGVTNYLPAGAGPVVSVGILEVNPEMQNPQDYLQAFSDLLPYDYLWFTPAVSAEDYCASLREGREQTALNGSASRSDN